MAVDALASKQSQQLVDECKVVYGYGELDMAAVAGTAQEGGETACCAAIPFSMNFVGNVLEAHGLSRNAPSAASCRPPDTGCSRESKVVGFVMRFTERVRTSFVERKPNSTFWIDEDMG